KKYFITKYPRANHSETDFLNSIYIHLLRAALYFDEYEKAKYYARLVKPQKMHHFLKVIIAKSPSLIRLSKKFKIVNINI
ncbi:MAG: hypothetical protein ACK5HT_08845, partial [Draconibacterium sp.]